MAKDLDDAPSGSRLVADGLMTVMEAARFLSVSQSTLYSLMDSGRLAYVKIGRARRLPRRGVANFAESNMTGGWSADVVA